MARRTIRAPKDPISVNPGDGGDDGGEDAIAKEAWARWKEGRKHLREWRKEAEENWDFIAGRQWSEEDMATLQAQMRTPMVFNRMMATMAAVSGYEINGRQEVTYLPREPSTPQPSPAVQVGEGGAPPQPNMPPPMNGQPAQGVPRTGTPGGSGAGMPPGMQMPPPGSQPGAPPEDHSLDESGEADVDTKAAKYFRQECDAEDEESEQFRHMLATGVGWIEHRMDYEKDPDGMMVVEIVDEFEMVYDPSAQRTNLTDRGWDIRGKWWNKDKAKDKWPKHDFDTPSPQVYDLDMDLDGKQPIDRLAASFYKSPGVGEQAETRKDKVGILEYTWSEQEPFYTTVNPTTGKSEDIEPAIHKKLQERLAEIGMPPAKSVKRTRRRYKRAFVHGRTTLEEGDAPCPEQFQYQCITGHRDRNKNTWFGLCSLMKDPQRWANKWLSQFLHQLNTNVKTGLWYEEGAFDNVGNLEKKVAKPGFVQKINAGYFDKVRKEEPAQIPTDAMNLMQFAISSIRDVTGANLELMGQQTNDQPGVVENARKQAAQNVLAPFFSAQRQYRKIAGRITLYFIREYLSDGRWIRIVGPANAKYVQLAKDRGNAKYDIIVDQSPSSPNQKEAVFGTLATILPNLMKEGLPVPPDLLDYVPGLPATLVEKWKQLIQEKAQQPHQDPKLALDAQKLQLDAKRMELEQAKHQQDAQASNTQDQLDKARLQFDQQNLQFMQNKEGIETQIKQQEMRLKEKQLELQREEMHSDEMQHFGELMHGTVTQHHDQLHEAGQAQQDRDHEADQATQDRDMQGEQADLDRGAAEKQTKMKTAAPKGKKLSPAQEGLGSLNKALADMAKGLAGLGKGQQELAKSMTAIADSMTAEKELYVDKKTGAKRVRRVLN